MSALSWGNTQVTFSNPLIKAVYGISIEWRLLKRMPSIPWILLLSLSPHPAALSSTLSSIWSLPHNCHQFIIWYQILASGPALLITGGENSTALPLFSSSPPLMDSPSSQVTLPSRPFRLLAADSPAEMFNFRIAKSLLNILWVELWENFWCLYFYGIGYFWASRPFRLLVARSLPDIFIFRSVKSSLRVLSKVTSKFPASISFKEQFFLSVEM